jgi:hypothetical protein
MTLTRYIVHIDTPNGVGSLEVPARNAEVAERRARVMAWTVLGWGEPDEISVVGCTEAADD